VHDPDTAAVQALQRERSVGTGTTQFDELLATGVDFVVLTGPCGSRLELVHQAAQQAVPVLLHAPMAPTLADAESMVAACEAADVRLGVLVPDMADPVAEQLRRMLVDGWFGGLVAVHTFRGDDDLLRHPPQRGDTRLLATLFGADPLLRFATADVHLVTWLTGRPCLHVAADATRGVLPLPCDSAVAMARLRGNLQAVFAASDLSAGRSLVVRGTDGHVQWLGAAVVVQGARSFTGDTFAYDTPGQQRVFDGASLRAARQRLSPALELHGRFARWLDDLDGFPCPAEQALLDMRTVDAMQRALVSGATEAP
jgi:predicted dehydrogenase